MQTHPVADITPTPRATEVLGRSASRVVMTSLFGLERAIASALEDDASDHPRESASRASWVAENLCALHGVHIVESGPRPDEPCVLVANHVSYLEPLAIVARNAAIGIAKREVEKWPVLGDAVRSAGTLFVDRSDPSSGARVLREACRVLEAGVSVVVFPEGTTTPGDRVLPFKRGAFGLARLARVPIVPVTVRFDRADAAWTGSQSFLPHYLRMVSTPQTRVFLHYGEPIVPAQRDLDAAGLAALARTRIETDLNRARLGRT